MTSLTSKSTTSSSAPRAGDLTSAPATDASTLCVKELIAALGDDKVAVDVADIKSYSKDNSYHNPRLPTAVVSVKSEDDIVKVLQICDKYGIMVIPFAAGSSLEGHIIPSKKRGGVVIDVAALDDIIVHESDLAVTVGPGVGWMDLNAKLAPTGLFFPPDPGAAAAVGGMCATNCSGTLAWRYGTMKDNVLGLRVVLPNGKIITTRRRVTKSSAGYDLTRLFIGSEGTLGVISQATLRLRRIPSATSVSLVQFPTLVDATQYVQALVVRDHAARDGLHRIELMDDACIRSTNFTSPWKLPELTTVLIECAGANANVVNGHSAVCEAISPEFRATSYQTAAHSLVEAEKYWSVRKKALFAAKHLRPEIKNASILITDVAVPISRLSDILHYSKDLLVENRLIAPIVAHAGDGNFHSFMVVDRTNPEEVKKAEEVRNLMAEKAIEYGGTCTGEHGIGKGKRDLLLKELGPDTVDVMRKLKKALDPRGIMNPGKIFKLVDGTAPSPKL